MRIYAKALSAGIFTVAVASSASAQVRFGVYAGDAQPYYPLVMQAQTEYVSPPCYYQDQDREVVLACRTREEWRERQEHEWRREQWQRQQKWRRQRDWDRHAEWHRDREHEHDGEWYGRD